MLSTQRTRDGHRAVVLVMVLGILATMTIVATAFVVFMGQSNKAAANTQYAAQAEIAARSGLEHAIRVIKAAGDIYTVTPDGALDSHGVFYDDPDAWIDPGDQSKGKVGPGAGWHRYFEWDPGDPGESIQLSDPTRWVSHYHTDQNTDGVNDEKYGAERFGAASPTEHLMRGRIFDISYPVAPATTRGQYAVCVVDLDGKLNARLANSEWSTSPLGYRGNALHVVIGKEDASGSVPGVAWVPDGGDLDTTRRSAFSAECNPTASSFSCLGEMARRTGASTAALGKYRLERCFTTYPILEDEAKSHEVAGISPYKPPKDETTITFTTSVLDAIGKTVVFPPVSPGDTPDAYRIVGESGNTVTVRGDCSGKTDTEITIVPPRPSVNVNTASKMLLRELLKWPVRQDANDTDDKELKAARLAGRLCERRPFKDRHEFEEAVRRCTGEDAVEPLDGGMTLTEYEFNSVLNNAAGTREWVASDPSSRVFGEGDSAYDDPDEPDKVGVYRFDGWEPYADGEGPAQTGGESDFADNSTRSTEFKFTSRFFHIYVAGRGWNVDAGRAVGVRRLHAIYDAEADGGKGRIVWLRWNLTSRGSVSDIQ